jgi:hypothetical protein
MQVSFEVQVDSKEVLGRIHPRAEYWLKLPMHSELFPLITCEEQHWYQIKPSSS